ncbi:MAG: hypothetical protein IJU18_03655 [Oscillospiraceae bacterium]|nr:hypothetical protein [Oscillospiraceae bacterium]
MKSIRGKFLLISMIGNTKGVCAYYLRIAPELTERDAPIRRCMPISAD